MGVIVSPLGWLVRSFETMILILDSERRLGYVRSTRDVRKRTSLVDLTYPQVRRIFWIRGLTALWCTNNNADLDHIPL